MLLRSMFESIENECFSVVRIFLVGLICLMIASKWKKLLNLFYLVLLEKIIFAVFWVDGKYLVQKPLGFD